MKHGESIRKCSTYRTKKRQLNRLDREKAQSRELYEQQRSAIEAAKKAAFIASTLSTLAYSARHLTAPDVIAAVKDADGLDYLYKGVCLYIHG